MPKPDASESTPWARLELAASAHRRRPLRWSGCVTHDRVCARQPPLFDTHEARRRKQHARTFGAGAIA
jgi:hypothetical protein